MKKIFTSLFVAGLSSFVVACSQRSSWIDESFLVPFFEVLIPFLAGTESHYNFDSSRLSLTSSGVELISVPQTDISNDILGFGGATLSGTQWDSTNSLLRLNSTSNTSSLDSSWAPAFGNLIAYWKMDESVGAMSALDSTGNGNTGTPANVTFGGSGKVVTSASFNGGNSTINLGNTSAFDFGTTTSFSVGIWVKYSNTFSTGNLRIVGNGASGYSNGWVLLGTDGSPGGALGGLFFYLGSGGVAANSVGFSGQQAYNDGNWHYVFVSVDQTAKVIRFYVDGLPSPIVKDSVTCAVASASSNSLSFSGCNSYDTNHVAVSSIGSHVSTSGFWNGSLDEIAIWNVALSAEQVQTIYLRQAPRITGMATSRVMDSLYTTSRWSSLSWVSTLPFFKALPDAGQSESSSVYSSQISDLMSGNKGLWHLDEAVGSILADGSGRSNTGTLSGGVTVSSPGVIGSSVLFDGSTGYATLGRSGMPEGNADRTVSMWIFPMASNSQSLFYYGSASSGAQVELYFNGSNVLLDYGGGTLSFGSVAVSIWTHIAFTQTGGVSRLYVNGVLINTATLTLNTSASDPTLATGERSRDTGAGGTTFMGAIDEVAVWSRGLSSSEILQLYRRGANRVRYQVRSCSDSGSVHSFV
jgi:trimeric autotransporter adhesin